MKKKLLSMVLSLIMVAGVLAGCGSTGSAESETTKQTTA